MAYTKEDLFYLGVTDLQSARKKIVDISLFDNIDNIKLDKLFSFIFYYFLYFFY